MRFSSAGAELGHDGFEVAGGFDIEIGAAVRLGARYAMSAANDWGDRTAKVAAAWSL